MDRLRRLTSRIGLIVTAFAVGTVAGGGCGLGSAAVNLVGSINPCGTIIACDPVEYDLLFNDVETPDFEECPVSVFPQDCVGVFPPTTGGGDTTGTTTGFGG